MPKRRLLLTQRQVLAICNARPTTIDDVVVVRDRCLLMLIVETGMRVRELRNIDTRDIRHTDKGRHMIRNVRGGRNAAPRTILISRALASALDDWLYVRPVQGPYLFMPTTKIDEDSGLWHDKALSEAYLYRIVAQYGELVGIQHLTPTDLRRYAARRSSGRGLIPTMRMLGHASPASTARLIGLQADDVIDTNHLY